MFSSLSSSRRHSPREISSRILATSSSSQTTTNNEEHSKADDGSSITETKQAWNLENSSFWWLQHDFFQHPGNILVLCSIPFCAGAYFGMRQPMKRMESLLMDDDDNRPKKTNSKGTEVTDKAHDSISSAERKAMGVKFASRALRLATLSSVGIFGMMGAATFYALGYDSVDEAVDGIKRWASSGRKSFEDWLAMDERASDVHPEVVATKHMSEDDEMNYLYETYLKADFDKEEEELKLQQEQEEAEAVVAAAAVAAGDKDTSSE